MEKSTVHKEGKADVKVIYYNSKTLADGSHPFMVRITKDRKRKYVATGLSLHPDLWNENTGAFRRTVPKAQREQLEADFRKWENKFKEAANELAKTDTVHTAASVTAKVSDERSELRKYKLLTYFDYLIEQFNNTGNVGNRKVYRDVQNNLARLIGAKRETRCNDQTNDTLQVWTNDVPFDGVTVKFCNGWENKMRAEGLTEITLSVKFRTLRAVLNRAISEQYATPDAYPFARNESEKRKFFIGKFKTKTVKRAINKADIRKIEAYQPTPYNGPYASLRDTSDRLQLAKDLFLLSYYCGGINFVDIAGLRWLSIGLDLANQPRLNYTRQKTGGDFSIRLMPPALVIIERYRAITEISPTAYIFPILSTALHKTPQQRHNRCNKILGQVNRDLKVIGAAVGIATPLTSYVARHSFATALKHSGVSTAIISEAMGHSDERTTQIYLSEFETNLVDAAFDNL